MILPKELRQRKIVDSSRGAPWCSVERNFSVFRPKIQRPVIFYLLGNPAETAYLSVRDGKLSKAVRLLEFRQRKIAVHTYLGCLKPVCSDGLRAGTIESHNFFVLGPILVKFHIRTRLIERFRTIFRTWWCGEEKLHFTPVHTLRQLKRDEARFHHLGGSSSFERGTGRYLYAGFGG